MFLQKVKYYMHQSTDKRAGRPAARIPKSDTPRFKKRNGSPMQPSWEGVGALSEDTPQLFDRDSELREVGPFG